MEALILILKETYNTCNFPAEGLDLLTPTSLWIKKSRESVETIDTPKYRLFNSYKLISLTVFMFWK